MMKGIKFACMLLFTTGLMAFVWEIALSGKIYDCTDDAGFGYLAPGQWVHGTLETVDHVTHRGMSEPDSIKRGWTVGGLWAVWVTMFSASVGSSAYFLWRYGKSKNESFSRQHE